MNTFDIHFWWVSLAIILKKKETKYFHVRFTDTIFIVCYWTVNTNEIIVSFFFCISITSNRNFFLASLDVIDVFKYQHSLSTCDRYRLHINRLKYSLSTTQFNAIEIFTNIVKFEIFISSLNLNLLSTQHWCVQFANLC